MPKVDNLEGLKNAHKKRALQFERMFSNMRCIVQSTSNYHYITFILGGFYHGKET